LRRRRSGELSSAKWAEAVFALYGRSCIECGDRDVQLDHVIPKSQGGLYVPGNGVPACGPFSRVSEFSNGCHKAKTDGELQYRRDQLHPVTLEHLADIGWVAWDEDGQPHGRGWRHFAPVPVPMKGGSE
jgi:5-methylcytosine-specific restriction endonuclease McrA